MCLARSKVKEVVPLDSIRSLLESASGELWREGEFRLEMVWKVLCQQPGLSAEHAAPPLLVFKSFEDALGVQVCLPDALSAIPRADQAKLREQLTITKNDFAQAIEELRALAAAESQREDVSKAVRAATDSAAPAPVAAPKAASPGRKRLAAALAVVAAAALSGSLWFALRDTSNGVDLSDVAPILQLAEGKQVDATMSARITDARWETLGADEQKRIAAQLFEREQKKGVRSLLLTDGQGHVRVTASDAPGRVMISVH
jgi:hypothetical protein